MKIVYFEKLTLVDYPGMLAATVFSPGCVFRCPYCHSPELVDPAHVDFVGSVSNKEEEFFTFLETRRGKLDGVCITGGEPTLHVDLIAFIQRVKKMGFRVKLDTNGNFPDRVETLLASGLIDYWAMDIKHASEKYQEACGVDVAIADIKKSVTLIMKHAKDYEFRTTTVPGIHIEEDFESIGRWITGARAYYIQPFRDVKVLDMSSAKNAEKRVIDYDACAERARKYVKKVIVR